MTERLNLREVTRETDAALPPAKSGIWTTEFWTMIGGALANIVVVAGLLGIIEASDAEGLTKAVTGMLTAAQMFVANGLIIWQYAKARVATKKSNDDTRLAMRQLAVEHLRLQMQYPPQHPATPPVA